MADLIAIGYLDEATAEAAADEALRLAHDLIIQPDAIAVISRDTDCNYHVHTNHHPVGSFTLAILYRGGAMRWNFGLGPFRIYGGRSRVALVG